MASRRIKILFHAESAEIAEPAEHKIQALLCVSQNSANSACNKNWL